LENVFRMRTALIPPPPPPAAADELELVPAFAADDAVELALLELLELLEPQAASPRAATAAHDTAVRRRARPFSDRDARPDRFLKRMSAFLLLLSVTRTSHVSSA